MSRLRSVYEFDPSFVGLHDQALPFTLRTGAGPRTAAARLSRDRTCALLISLGYPAGRPLAPVRRPDRRPFDEVVHRGRW